MIANYSQIFHLKSKYRINEQEFKQRTKELALRVIKLVSSLPKNTVSEVIGKQLIRSGTSVGGNYQAACRARATADLIAKLRIVNYRTLTRRV